MSQNQANLVKTRANWTKLNGTKLDQQEQIVPTRIKQDQIIPNYTKPDQKGPKMTKKDQKRQKQTKKRPNQTKLDQS